jgi:hypothetical protein
MATKTVCPWVAAALALDCVREGLNAMSNQTISTTVSGSIFSNGRASR